MYGLLAGGLERSSEVPRNHRPLSHAHSSEWIGLRPEEILAQLSIKARRGPIGIGQYRPIVDEQGQQRGHAVAWPVASKVHFDRGPAVVSFLIRVRKLGEVIVATVRVDRAAQRKVGDVTK